MKKCKICNEWLSEEMFSWKDKLHTRLNCRCKKCHSEYMKDKYKEKKIFVDDIKKNSKCAKCGYSKCILALECHHINRSEKENTIARLKSDSYPIEKVMNEIKKCVILCSNCHREFHYLNKLNGITILDFIHSAE